MSKYFNIEGFCNPIENYMVNLDSRLKEIKMLIDSGKYFTINRARQYGKTTVINALENYLSAEYEVISLDFQLFSHADFKTEMDFVLAFVREILFVISDKKNIPEEIVKQWNEFSDNKKKECKLGNLFLMISEWCAKSKKPMVLIIDETDSATNNQVFLDFLAQLRGYYIHRKKRATFYSVILAGVYDIKNLRRKIRQDDEHRMNSPWNIAADFHVEMSFSVVDILGMLQEYEKDHHTGMNVEEIATMIYEYTSGYPFLVSRICKIIDEDLTVNSWCEDYSHAWTKEGVLEAVKQLLAEKNTLFESLTVKLGDYPMLKEIIYALLFTGKTILYNPDEEAIDVAIMFGFVKNDNGSVIVANRIFETRLYNMFLTSSKMQSTNIYKAALQDKNQFIEYGHLNMDLVLERFILHFDDLYGDQSEVFREDDGRRYFLLYLKPIINGTGSYYIEARTRNLERTDVIVNYNNEQFIIELKIWHGEKYNTRGEKQLVDYLDHYHLQKGYMLSFNFNKNKQVGIKRLRLGERVLIEAVV